MGCQHKTLKQQNAALLKRRPGVSYQRFIFSASPSIVWTK
jgi:hypothetical protein